MRDTLSRLTRHWVYGGFLAGLLLLILLPELAHYWSSALLVVFLQLPLYMLHQFEEHDDDRFRRFVNRTIGGGREVLSPLAVFVINVPGVWGLIVVSFYLCAKVAVGYGLIAVYLTLVNAMVHIAHGVIFRAYNPGLVTAVVLFLPASIIGLVHLQKTGQIGWFSHLLGLAIAIGVHLAIIAYVNAVGRKPTTRSQESAGIGPAEHIPCSQGVPPGAFGLPRPSARPRPRTTRKLGSMPTPTPEPRTYLQK